MRPPGEEVVVLEAGFAVGERRADESLDRAASRGVPFHRRAKSVEICFVGGDHTEFEGAAAALALGPHKGARRFRRCCSAPEPAIPVPAI